METILTLLMEHPEAITPVVKEYVNKYKPIAYSLAQEFVEVYKDYSNNTEYPAVIAKTKKNMYDAYINVGFTEDQALALMINDNIQFVNYLRKISTDLKSVS